MAGGWYFPNHPMMYGNSFQQAPRRTICPHKNRNSYFDLWELLNEQPLLQRSHPLMGACPVCGTDARHEPEAPKQPWIHRLQIRGYDSGDISVKVEENKVVVHAFHEETNGDDMDRYETRRTVNIPETVNKEKISSFLLDGGNLVITAPYIETEPQKGIKERYLDEDEIVIPIQHEPRENQAVSTQTMKPGEKHSDCKSKGDASMVSEEKSEGDKESTVLKGAEKKASGGDDGLEEFFVITPGPPSPVQVAITGDNTQLVAESTLPPLMDSKEIVEVDGGKAFQLSMNLKSFKPENVSIKFKDNVVSIDAKKELNKEGIISMQKIHREFLVPGNGDADKVSAKMSDSGFVKVLVPLLEEKEGQSVEDKKDE